MKGTTYQDLAQENVRLTAEVETLKARLDACRSVVALAVTLAKSAEEAAKINKAIRAFQTLSEKARSFISKPEVKRILESNVLSLPAGGESVVPPARPAEQTGSQNLQVADPGGKQGGRGKESGPSR